MKFIGWVMSAGLVAAATGAMAKPLTPTENGLPTYSLASDIGGPYAAMPPEPQGRRYAPESYAPPLLPRSEVYALLRENGYSPLGIPQLRGAFYSIAVVNLDGDDGRLVIDGRNGRLVRFIPAWRIGHWADDEAMVGYGPQAMLPRIPETRRAPRPPLSIPRVASRSVPLPKAMPPRAVAEPKGDVKPELKAGADKPAPAPQPAPALASQLKPATAPPSPAPAPVEAKPSPSIAPTQTMPAAQGLE